MEAIYSSEMSSFLQTIRRYYPERSTLHSYGREALKPQIILIPCVRMIKSGRMRWARHVARIKEKRNAYRILMGNPEGKRPLGRPRRRWVDILKWILER
jgi:hypothetical protein